MQSLFMFTAAAQSTFLISMYCFFLESLVIYGDPQSLDITVTIFVCFWNPRDHQLPLLASGRPSHAYLLYCISQWLGKFLSATILLSALPPYLPSLLAAVADDISHWLYRVKKSQRLSGLPSCSKKSQSQMACGAGRCASIRHRSRSCSCSRNHARR